VDPVRALGPLPAKARRFAPSDLHVTVAFLGPVGDAAAARAFEAAGALDMAPLDVRLGAVHLLGSKRRPSAVAALVDAGGPALVEAMAAHRAAMWEAAGARRDDRPPLPHVTLARIARRATPAERRAVAAALEGRRLDVSGRVTRLALYTWAEDRTQALFRIVTERPLGP
jgi:2'-5' RNA ligase